MLYRRVRVRVACDPSAQFVASIARRYLALTPPSPSPPSLCLKGRRAMHNPNFHIDEVNQLGETALHIAVEKGRLPSLVILSHASPPLPLVTVLGTAG